MTMLDDDVLIKRMRNYASRGARNLGPLLDPVCAARPSRVTLDATRRTRKAARLALDAAKNLAVMDHDEEALSICALIASTPRPQELLGRLQDAYASTW